MSEFFIKCNPPKSTAQGSSTILKRRDGSMFVGKFANSKAKKVQSDLMSLFRPHVPENPFEGPVELSVTWTYPWRKSETKKRMAEQWLPCDKRPDVDNLCKMLFDIMTRLNYWRDDSQVSNLHFIKGWGDYPGIGIVIEEMPNGVREHKNSKHLRNKPKERGISPLSFPGGGK